MRKIIVLMSVFLPLLALAQTDDPTVRGSAENPAVMNEEAVNYASNEGDFRVIFPAGCGKIVTKLPNDEGLDPVDKPTVKVTVTYCDRFQKKGEGCSVTSYFEVTAPDGGYPGPDQVLKRITRFLDTMNVSIQHQNALRKVLPDSTVIEGLDVYAGEKFGVGQAWVRGVIYQGDIYVLAAWKSTGGLWSDPDYATFFNSFQPGAE